MLEQLVELVDPTIALIFCAMIVAFLIGVGTGYTIRPKGGR